MANPINVESTMQSIPEVAAHAAKIRAHVRALPSTDRDDELEVSADCSCGGHDRRCQDCEGTGCTVFYATRGWLLAAPAEQLARVTEVR